MSVERRGQAIRVMVNLANWRQEEPTGCGGGRQLSMDGTSRVNREVYARFCERLGVKCPGRLGGEQRWSALLRQVPDQPPAGWRPVPQCTFHNRNSLNAPTFDTQKAELQFVELAHRGASSRDDPSQMCNSRTS
jgi:hypothetical protein